MKRSIFTLLFVLCLIMSSAAYANNINTENEPEVVQAFDTLKMSEEELAIYEEALAQYDGAIIYDRLIAAFIKKFGVKDGYPARYPENYAGTYFDKNGKLVIQISSDNNTDQQNEDYSIYIDIEEIKKFDEDFKANSMSDVVVYEHVKYSLNQLEDMMNDITEKLSKEDTPVWSSYVDTFNNNIVLEFEQEVFDSVSNIDSKVKLFIRTEYPEKEIPAIIKPVEIENLAFNHIGGQGYYQHGNYTSGVTLGFTGWYNGVRSYLSCGHDSSFLAGDSASYNFSTIGSVTAKQWKHNEAGDWSIIKLNSGETISGLIKQNYQGTATGKIKSRSNALSVGQIVYTFGHKTAIWSSYRITDINKPITLFDDYVYKYLIIKGLTTTDLVTGALSAKGDSGSPIVLPTTGGFSAVGTLTSYNPDGISFSPMLHVPSNFAVEIGY